MAAPSTSSHLLLIHTTASVNVKRDAIFVMFFLIFFHGNAVTDRLGFVMLFEGFASVLETPLQEPACFVFTRERQFGSFVGH
jgi:hypothetical protein